MCGVSIPAGLHSFAIVDKKYGVFFNRFIFDNVGSMICVDMFAVSYTHLIQRMYGIAMNRHLRHVGDEYQWNIGVHLT